MAGSDSGSNPHAAEHAALMTLHAAAGTFGNKAPLLEGPAPTISEALNTVAAADPEAIPAGARLDLFHALARARYPGIDDHGDSYQELADSVGTGLDGDQVIHEMNAVATGAVDIGDTATAGALDGGNSIAFVGEDLCSVQHVTVNGKPAVWVFSEFETNAPFEGIAEWVDPHNWSERAPMMFKHMAPEEGTEVTPLPGAGKRWHGDFQEEVQFGKYLVTGLHCDFAQEDTFAVVTYRRNWSRDNQISVDRGFLMVNDLGANRQVKVLKVVAFADQALDEFADTVCPLWTDFIRGAVRGGSRHAASAATTQPGTGFLGPNMRKMMDIYRQGATDYVNYVGQWTKQVMAGDYQARQLVLDTVGYWSELARDWARAWTAGNDMLREMAEASRTFAPFGGPQGRDGSESEGTTIPMPDIDVNTAVAVSDLTLLGKRPTVIPSARVSANLVRLEGGALGVHIEAASTGVDVGMYLGELTYGPQKKKRPVQLYVSHSTVG